VRDGVKDEFAHAGGGQQHDDQAVDDDEAHRFGPGDLTNNAHGQERVDAQAGSETERQPRDDAEQDGHHPGGEGGHGGDLRVRQPVPGHVEGGLVGAESAEDQRVENHDVGHGHEGDHAAANFPAPVRAAAGDLEVAVDRATQTATGVRCDRFGRPDLSACSGAGFGAGLARVDVVRVGVL